MVPRTKAADVVTGYRGPAGSYTRIAIGPGQWMGYLRSAAMIATSTFHGAVFAAKMGRPFVVIAREWNALKITDFARRIGLVHRVFEAGQCPNTLPAELWRNDDVVGAREKLEHLRTDSDRFLDEALALIRRQRNSPIAGIWRMLLPVEQPAVTELVPRAITSNALSTFRTKHEFSHFAQLPHDGRVPRLSPVGQGPQPATFRAWQGIERPVLPPSDRSGRAPEQAAPPGIAAPKRSLLHFVECQYRRSLAGLPAAISRQLLLSCVGARLDRGRPRR